MDKKLIRLTESELRRMVSESVKSVLDEASFDSIRKNGWQDRLNHESPNGYGSRDLLYTADRIANICAKYGAAPGYKPYFRDNY